MTENSPSPSDDVLRVAYTTTQDEVALYGRLSSQRHTGVRESWDGDWLIMYVVAGLSVTAGLICVATGAVSDVYNPSVPLLCGATYYLAEPVRNWLVSRYHKRNRAAALADFVGRSYEVELAPAGVTQRTGHYKYTMEWPGIEQVTVNQSVMFMWTSDRSAIVVPLRAVPEQDRSRAVDIAKSRGASLRQADLPSRRDGPTATP